MNKPRIDWLKAESFYLALDPPRSFGDVARRFGVSDTAVRNHAIPGKWREKAAEIDDEARAKARQQIIRSRQQRVRDSLQFVDAFLTSANEKLATGELDVKAGDVPALVKLAELLEGEATDRIAVGEVRTLVQAVVVVAGEFVPKELREPFLTRLSEVTSGLTVIEQGDAS